MSLSPHPFSAGPSASSQNGTQSFNDRSGIITAIYILYAIGFFFNITALIGFIMAYVYGQAEDGNNKLHFEFQKGIFKVGFVIMLLIILLGLVTFVALGFSIDTESLSSTIIFLVACLLICLLSLYWFIWTIMTILFGFKALSRDEAPTTDKILGISPLPKKYRTPVLSS